MDKPLPNIPAAPSRSTRPGPNLNNLSIEGRNHLRRFILQILDEETNNLPEHEVWAEVLDGALRQLGESITSGGWLPGIRRARILRNAQENQKVVVRFSSESGKGDKEEGQGKPDSAEQQPLSAAAPKVQDDLPSTTSLQTPEDKRKKAFESLKSFTSKPVVPVPKPTAKHVLLTTAPFGSTDASAELDYEILRSNAGCIFSPRVFMFPHDNSEGDAAILYGLSGWLDTPPEDGSLQVVGGTFTFLGLSSTSEYASLVKILRLSIFFFLSLVLEQHMLSDSHVTLHFQKPAIPFPEPGPVQRTMSASSVGSRHRKDPVSGLWAYLSKKKDNILHRAIHIGPTPPLIRSGSLDLTPSRSKPHPRTSDDSEAPRPRKLSFIADFRPSFLSQREPEPTPSEIPPFESTLSLLKRYEDMLSTSPGVKFSPPLILVRLAERERSDPKRKLTGDEKAALSSLLGWAGRREPAKHMVGTCGFVRQQGISLLYSEHVPMTSAIASRASTPSSSSSQSSSSISLPPPSIPPKLTHCGSRRNWVTYRFYDEHDKSLGDTVTHLCASADDSCREPGCGFKRGQHEIRWIHGGTRIVVNTSSPNTTDEKGPESDDELPRMWESCALCQKKSSAVRMQDGTYLLSFAKYIEILVYSSTIFRLAKPLCEHTTYSHRRHSSASKDPLLPNMRFNIVRSFSWKGKIISFTLSPVHDIYEVSVPRLQIMKGRPGEKNDDTTPPKPEPPVLPDDDRRKLRREIMKFWQGLFDHMDSLENNFAHEDPERYHSKSLPRLPSSDDAYESDDGAITPKVCTSRLPSRPPNTPRTPESTSTPQQVSSNTNAYPFPGSGDRSDTLPASDQAAGTSSTLSTSSLATSSAASSAEIDSLHRLTNLRHTFQKTERTLYTELSHTPEASLNDVRRSFQSAARGATKRLSAWETKHAANVGEHSLLPTDLEPDWWQSGCHAVPGGNVIVRENDWGSIIAFTLSSLDYHRELANLSAPNVRSISGTVAPPSTPDAAPRPSFLSKTVPGKWFAQTTPQLDPDQEGVVWHEPEAYSAVISRKEHPRDPASLLMTIPDVLRQKNVQDNNGSTPSRFATLGLSSSKLALHVPPPPSAWAKPEVQISMDAADGKLSSSPVDAVDKLLHELDGAPELSESRRNSDTDSYGSSSFVETNIRRGKASSIMSTGSDTPTIGRSSNRHNSSTPPPPPPKDNSTPVPGTPIDENGNPTPTKSSISTSLTNTLSAAFRYMVKAGEMQPPPKHHHGLLHTASPAIDERPHIKYDWTIGKRLKFSCTVYYAKQFDSLRKRCGISDLFLKSLSRSENWFAEGGKSKSNFWKTSDDQFIIKTLVNAWNVADLQVLIDLGPSYFRHMDATANKPTVLAKLLGFYTVEIRNLETGAIQAKADLLVMENLFYSQRIARTFDLKGIQGRRVKAAPHGASESKTLFDGDWIEGQQKALTLLHPHSKFILDEAIRADCEFLAKSNIMDYSLLLGVCEERKLLACGLVDTIGSYTFAKTLEYKAKQGLNSGKEVTVVPPTEYQHRFVNAMDNYFLACPDRWTRPMDDTKVPNDCRQLPSVL